MSAADTIKEYVVGLGYEVDEKSEANFKAALFNAGVIAASFGAAIYSAASRVKSFVDAEAAGLSDLQNFSNLVKVSAEEVEAWSYAADILGSSAGAARSSIRGLAQMIGAAAQGFPRAIKVFERLGLNVKKANGETKTAIELFAEVGDKIRDLPREQQLSYLSKLGIDPTLIRALTEDWSDLRVELAKINRAVGVSKTDAAKLGNAYTDAGTKLQKVVAAIYQGIAIRLMPRLIRSMDELRRKLVQELPNIIAYVVPILEKILDVAKAAGELLLDMAGIIGDAVRTFNELDAATGGWLKTFLLAYIAWKAWNSEIANSPTGKILKLAALFTLLYQDYKAWRDGTARSAIDWGSWFGRMLIWLGKAYVAWKIFWIGVGLAFSALWGFLKLLGALAVFVAISYGIDLVLKKLGLLTGLVRTFNALRFLAMADDLLLVAAPLALVGALLAWIAYKVIKDLYDNWDAVIFGWSKLPFLLGYWAGKAQQAVVAAFQSIPGILAGWAQAAADSFHAAVFGWSKLPVLIGYWLDQAEAAVYEWADNSVAYVIQKWEDLKAWFNGWVDWFSNLDPLSGFTGGYNASFAAPSPARAAALAGPRVDATNNVNIRVEGGPDSMATGRAAVREATGAVQLWQRNLGSAMAQ